MILGKISEKASYHSTYLLAPVISGVNIVSISWSGKQDIGVLAYNIGLQGTMFDKYIRF